VLQNEIMFWCFNFCFSAQLKLYWKKLRLHYGRVNEVAKRYSSVPILGAAKLGQESSGVVIRRAKINICNSWEAFLRLPPVA